MCKSKLEYCGQLVLILKAILLFKNVESSVVYTPETVINLEEPINTLGQAAGKLSVMTMRLSRRQSNINGFGEGEIEHTYPIDENGKYVGTYSPRCHETLVMGKIRAPKTLELDPDIMEDGGHICHWAIIGADLCVPQITCSNFSLMDRVPKSNPETSKPSLVCIDEYLEVFDGSVGKSRYCGKEGPQKLISGRYLRDLYITLKLAPGSGKDRMFQCEIICHHPVDDMLGDDDPGNQLPEIDDEPKVSTSCWCGRADIHDGEGETRKSEFPWTAALVTTNTRKPFCAGTLINDMFILTSAHCLRGPHRNISNVEILLNPHTMNITKIPYVKKGENMTKYLMKYEKLIGKDKEDNSYRYKAQKYYLHPLFARQNRDFDVALIKLEKAIDFKTMKDIVPICLPDPGQYEHNKEGTHAVVTGWGLRSFVNGTFKNRPDYLTKLRILEKQWLEVYHYQECLEIFRWRYSHRMMCAGHKKNETYIHESQVEVPSRRMERNSTMRMCAADPGGGLFSFRSKTVYEQIGILAYANEEGCEYPNKGPAIFIDTRQVSNWINYVCTSEEAVWCSA